MIKKLFPLLIAILSAALLSAQVRSKIVEFPNGRTSSMGGPHVALADDFFSLFSNPAGFVDAKSGLSVFNVTARVAGPVFDIASLIISSIASGGTFNFLSPIGTILSNSGGKLYTSVNALGPIAFGWVGNGLGFGLFNRTYLLVNAASINSILIQAAEDLYLAGGYAFQIPLPFDQAISFGLLPKGFLRAEVPIATTLFTIQNDINKLQDLLTTYPFAITTGIGFDVGFKYSWQRTISFGVSCRDAYSPTLITNYSSFTDFTTSPASAKTGDSVGSSLSPNLAVGFAYTPYLGSIERYISSFKLAVDYSDILDILSPLPRNPALNVGIGTELTLLDIFSLRLGVYDGLLSAGMGFVLSFFTLDFAMFGRELGYQPGDRPVYNLSLGLSAKF